MNQAGERREAEKDTITQVRAIFEVSLSDAAAVFGYAVLNRYAVTALGEARLLQK